MKGRVFNYLMIKLNNDNNDEQQDKNITKQNRREFPSDPGWIFGYTQ